MADCRRAAVINDNADKMPRPDGNTKEHRPVLANRPVHCNPIEALRGLDVYVQGQKNRGRE
jgi:hypothetical protein